MRSVRLDPDLDDQLRRAAAAEGSSVSEFIRNAVSERTKRILSDRTSERLADVIGTVRAGGGQAARTGKAFAELISEQHATK